MSYRVRFTTHTGATGYWDGTFATLAGASMSALSRADVTGYTYTVEKVVDAPEPGTTAAHHVEILRERVKELENVQNAMHRDLAFAIQIGDAMREAMRTGEWRAGHDSGMASSAIAGWDRFKPSLAAAPGVLVAASEAPGEGGDSDRRRLEALERYLEGDTFHQIWKTSKGAIVAGTTIEGQEVAAPTLSALAAKLAEREAKP